jgi:23S rRNA (cytosine1962-C5)-methyltransferase
VGLVGRCHELLTEGGELFFSTNLRSFELDPALQKRFAMREITHHSVPEDFQRTGRPPHRAWHVKR